jgi:hypothetical protein
MPLMLKGKKPEMFVAKYIYSAQRPDELNLKKGQVIQVLSKSTREAGWWLGYVMPSDESSAVDETGEDCMAVGLVAHNYLCPLKDWERRKNAVAKTKRSTDQSGMGAGAKNSVRIDDSSGFVSRDERSEQAQGTTYESKASSQNVEDGGPLLIRARS